MGFFSWKTQDTDRSIANQYSIRKPFTVVMIDDKGNQWVEDEYEGYGVFGGKDYYELLSEMNGGPSDRRNGIDMAFDNGLRDIKHPNLVELADGWTFDPRGPENCKDQGYFYSEDDTDDSYFEDDSEEKYWKNVTTYSERNSVTDEDLW